jgi:hypothetical protein
MTQMDEVPHYEGDVYVEDDRAAAMLVEIITAEDANLAPACQIIPYGAASVGRSLGQMVQNNRFPRPSTVFLDGDRGAAPGCALLPGDDAPERVVFEGLRERAWRGLAERTGRSYPDVVDACNKAMTLTDHHDWVRHAAVPLILGGNMLWQAMCALWATSCLSPEARRTVTEPIRDTLVAGGPASQELVLPQGTGETQAVESETMPEPASPSEPQQLF